MTNVSWARSTAEELLRDTLPRRWAHTQGVAARARSLAAILGEDADLIEAAAWLHDIGYSPQINETGFHPIDGARYLRDKLSADETLSQLVAHHTGAAIEAEERGLPRLEDEFAVPSRSLLEALVYCDMTADIDGRPVEVEQRLDEILTRYGHDHIVNRSVRRSAPILRRAVGNIRQKLRESPVDGAGASQPR